MEILAALIYQLLTFHCRAGVVFSCWKFSRFCDLVIDATLPGGLRVNWFWFGGNVIWLASLLNTKTDEKKPLEVEWLFCSFDYKLMRAVSAMNFWLSVKKKEKEKRKLRPVIHSVIHWLASLCPSVENKPDTALLYPWCSAQMCHLPWGHAERVGSTRINDPKERHLGKNNEKNGLWMLRGLCWNDWCCLREGFRPILGEGRKTGDK